VTSRRASRSRPLPPTALALLRRIADLQRNLGTSVSVSLVIVGQSARQWNALQLLSERSLISAVEPGIVRLTRAGWGFLGSQRPSDDVKRS